MSVSRALQSFLLCAAAFLFGSCQTSNPGTRISQNPVMFQHLSPEHQVLVQQGRICEGMTKDGVFLAWGNPNTPPVTGQKDGTSYEKWVYQVYSPVMMDTVTVGVGCGYHWHGTGIGSSTAYVPHEAAWVIFHNDLVTSWEKRVHTP